MQFNTSPSNLVEPVVPAMVVPSAATDQALDWKDSLKANGFRSALIVDDAYAPVTDDEVVAEHKAAFINFLEDRPDALKGVLTLCGFAENHEPSWEQDIFARLDLLWGQIALATGDLRQALEMLFDAALTERLTKRVQLKQVIEVLKDCGLQVVTSHHFDHEVEDHRTADILFVDLYVDKKITDGDTDAAVAASAPIAIAFIEKSTGSAGSKWRQGKCSPPVFVISSHSAVRDINGKMIRQGVKRSCLRSMHKSDAEHQLMSAIQNIDAHVPLALSWQAFKSNLIEELAERVKRISKQVDDVDIREVALLHEAVLKPSSEDFEPYVGWLVGEAVGTGMYEVGVEAAKTVDFPAGLVPIVDGRSDPDDAFVQLYQESSVVYKGLDRTVEGNKYAAQIFFGDLFVNAGPAGDSVKLHLVMSRSCDVIRSGDNAEILCLVAVAKKAEAQRELENAHTALDGVTRTVLIAGSPYLYSFLKLSSKTLPLADLGDTAKFKRVARLSRLHALKLQQQMLADLGRVGAPSEMGLLDAFDAEIRVILEGVVIYSVRSPEKQYYSALAYRRRTPTETVLKVTFTSSFLTFLVQSLSAMEKTHADAHRAVKSVIHALQKLGGPLEFEATKGKQGGQKLAGQGLLKAYVRESELERELAEKSDTKGFTEVAIILNPPVGAAD